jgi:CcmD family protein
MRKIIAALAVLIFFAAPLLAQTTPPDEPVQMADALHASGKIYVVVAVVVVILAGLFSYLIYLDKKISRLEKK